MIVAMFGRKKKTQGEGDIPVTPVPAAYPTPPGAAVDPTMDQLRDLVPGLMDALGSGQADIRRTVVSTSITENGHEVDPNSDEGRKLMAMLDGMGITLPNPTAGAAAAPMPAPASMARPATPAVDQGAVAMALQQAQSDPQKLPQIVALVDDYVHGRVDHAHFESGRRRIVGY